jgi:hypothetical protein
LSLSRSRFSSSRLSFLPSRSRLCRLGLILLFLWLLLEALPILHSSTEPLHPGFCSLLRRFVGSRLELLELHPFVFPSYRPSGLASRSELRRLGAIFCPLALVCRFALLLRLHDRRPPLPRPQRVCLLLLLLLPAAAAACCRCYCCRRYYCCLRFWPSCASRVCPRLGCCCCRCGCSGCCTCVCVMLVRAWARVSGFCCRSSSARLSGCCCGSSSLCVVLVRPSLVWRCSLLTLAGVCCGCCCCFCRCCRPSRSAALLALLLMLTLWPAVLRMMLRLLRLLLPLLQLAVVLLGTPLLVPLAVARQLLQGLVAVLQFAPCRFR